jgi:hypothetical protein
VQVLSFGALSCRDWPEADHEEDGRSSSDSFMSKGCTVTADQADIPHQMGPSPETKTHHESVPGLMSHMLAREEPVARFTLGIARLDESFTLEKSDLALLEHFEE